MTSFEEIRDNMAFLEDWEDRYRYVIELGRQLEPMPEEMKTSETKVDGCASQVWIYPSVDDSVLTFLGDSDAHIVRGLIAILHSLYSGQTLESIRQTDAIAKMQELGLDTHLSAQRSNGLRAMVGRIQALARA